MNLFANHFFSKGMIFFCCFFILTLSNISINASAEQRKNAIKTKKILSARLDSIEMEKQDRKRQGKPLDDLEIESKKIHDSIVYLRTELSSTVEPVLGDEQETDEQSSLSFTLKSFFNPGTIFDWILIIVGIVALLSGIILVVGLVHTLTHRKKGKPRSPAHILPKKLESRTATEEPPVSPPLTPQNMTEKETRGIESILERMERHTPQDQHIGEGVSPFADVNQEEHLKERKSRDSVRDKVIMAANEGLDVHEISRKLHVSVDQVTLILRIAAKEHKRDR